MSVGRILLPFNLFRNRNQDPNPDVDKTGTTYRDRFRDKDSSIEARKKEVTSMVNEYYDLATDLYEFGWGQAFHFAPRYVGETFYESLARHEYFLALQGGFKRGQHIIDIGCGVGGPLRNIVRFTGAHVCGINNHAYQVSRAKRYDKSFGLDGLTSYLKTDFNDMSLESNSQDGAYAIEATCHAADRTRCFTEVFRVLKPGACFVAYDWVVTPKYNGDNAEHRRIRHGIEVGDALPTLVNAEQVLIALRSAGFVIEDTFDVVERFENGSARSITWYQPLEGSYCSLSGFKSTPVGRKITATMLRLMETCHVAPKGSCHATAVLEEAAVNLVLGGKLQIFTPALFFKASKPVA